MPEISCSFADCLLIFKSSLSFNSGSIQSNILKTQLQSLAVTKEILPNSCLLRTLVMFLGMRTDHKIENKTYFKSIKQREEGEEVGAQTCLKARL